MAHIFSVKDFGAVGDGIHNDSDAFASALSAAANCNGQVRVPSGTWSCGPLEITSGIELHLEEGSCIKFIPDFELYTPVQSRWEGVNCWCMHPCFYVHDTEHVKITGTGVLDGSGQAWWDAAGHKRVFQTAPETKIEKELARLNPGYQFQPGGGGGRPCQFLRPPLVQFKDCTDVLLEGVTIMNSPFWTVHPLYSDHIVLRNITIVNPADAPNTDGIDVDSCTDVLISHCNVDVGDDGIALKSGSGPDGIVVGRPTSKVVVEHCTVRSAHGGVVLGSETAAGIWNIQATDCLFDGTDRGIRIKTRRGRGGHIHDLEFSHLVMKNNLCPITVNMYYRCGAVNDECFSLGKLPVDHDTPHVEHIRISSCRAEGSRASAGFIVGLPESPITDLAITDCTFAVDPAASVAVEQAEMYCGLPSTHSRGMRCRNVEAVFSRVSVVGVSEPFILEDGSEIQMND